MNVLGCLIILFLSNNVKSQCIPLPPLPELWSLSIDEIVKGEKNENWLSDYRFLAPPRVKPGEKWNARVEATWIGPSLLDQALLNYIRLVFNPTDQRHSNFWYGNKVMNVSSYDHNTKKIVFSPVDTENFMISSKSRIGVYNGMQFSLRIGSQTMSGMNVMINTRTNRDVEVTCSDGIFCNGEERYVKFGNEFRCVNAMFGACDDQNGDPCASYDCIESDRECSPIPKNGLNCKSCNSSGEAINTTKICIDNNFECGWHFDNSVNCGTCSNSDLVCSKGKCLSISSLGEGSCNKPYRLYNESLVIPLKGLPTFTIFDDLSLPKYVDHVSPVCNPAPVPDVVYEFRIESPELMGIEVQMLSADGSIDSMDTVLALTDESCKPLDLYSYCGDDSSPPGAVSSRIFGKLKNGTYKLVATAFSDVKINVAPFQLRVKFYPNCLPQCEGNRKCGSDGCGGECGSCSNGEKCDLDSGTCRADPCIPQCTNIEKDNVTEIRECGGDGCGGLCGSCDVVNQEMCISETGKCIKVEICNSLLPVCIDNPPVGMINPYCGNDCKWHGMNDLFGDLIPNNKSWVLPSIEFNWVKVENRSCAFVEGCHKKRGNRLLMRFDTYIHNTGRDLFYPPPAAENPNYFEWSPCHSHFHFQGFALFNLFTLDSKLISKGGKRGYCMEDTIQTMHGSHVPCDNFFDCTNQGIQHGWADLYPNVLDCQWLDITEIEKEKWYVYEICSNVDRKLHEASNTNDCKRFPVYVPEVELEFDIPSIKYFDMLEKRGLNQNSAPKIQLEPGIELN